MNEREVIYLMKSSKSEKEWNANCDKVKVACNGYPSFWYRSIVMSGIAAEVFAGFGSDASIHIDIKNKAER